MRRDILLEMALIVELSYLRLEIAGTVDVTTQSRDSDN